MSVYAIDPVRDLRWAEFLASQPSASVFHSPGWLAALQRTYGYQPVVFTTSPPDGPVANGLAACAIRTVFGTRLVSLPFSDHCEPLAERSEDLGEIVDVVSREVGAGIWRSVEVRPCRPLLSQESARGLTEAARYCLHRLDLSPGLDTIAGRLHPSCVRRAIRRAEREHVEYEVGTSASLLARLYRLLCTTRRRHGLPPPPRAWFRNLIECLGDRVSIRVASRDGQALAGVLTITFGRTVVYKYGGSDAAHHRLGAMPYLLWRTICESKEQGIEALDLGRSDLTQPGLVAFKERLGADRLPLVYYRCPATRRGAAAGWMQRVAGRLFAIMPDPALVMAGRLLYRHLG